MSQFCFLGFPKPKYYPRGVSSLTPTGSFHKVGPVAHRTSKNMYGTASVRREKAFQTWSREAFSPAGKGRQNLAQS